MPEGKDKSQETAAKATLKVKLLELADRIEKEKLARSQAAAELRELAS